MRKLLGHWPTFLGVSLAATLVASNSRHPYSTPDLNPFAVQGSGIGKTLASYMGFRAQWNGKLG